MNEIATLLPAAASALAAGALGGVHCGAMCGGIAVAHAAAPGTLGARPIVLTRHNRSMRDCSQPLRNLAFNGGRIASYALAGALAGGIGGAGFLLQDLLPARQALYALSSLMLIALGLYIGGWWRGLAMLERGGAALWRHVQPTAAALLRSGAPTWRHSFMLGTLWGWVPCGMVYSMLVTALATGQAGAGALVMTVFGLGTLPSLLAIGWAGGRYMAFSRRPAWRAIAAAIIVMLGIAGLARVPALGALEGFGALARLCQPLTGVVER